MASFAEFSSECHELLDIIAKAKGYNTGPDGAANVLFDFCQHMNLTHPEGEIIYKVIRYHRKRDPRDLLKIAGWAFLIWRGHGAKDNL